MRVGKVKIGELVIVNEIKKGNLKFVIVVNDVFDNIVKLIIDKCKSYKVLFRKFGNWNELGIVFGKGECVNVGIIDLGFVKKLLLMIDEYYKEWLYE